MQQYAFSEFNGYFGDPAQEMIEPPGFYTTDLGNPRFAALLSGARIMMIDGQPLGSLANYTQVAEKLVDDFKDGRRDNLELTAIRGTTEVFTLTMQVEPTHVAAAKRLEAAI